MNVEEEMRTLHKLLSWDNLTEKRLEQIEATDFSEVPGLVRSWKNDRLSLPDVHLLLALASARWIDHRGPFVGHGTFNGGPILRASSILSPPFKMLALLQMIAYVFDLLRHPNYGPYLMLESFEVSEGLSQTFSAFIPDLESGEQALLSQHRAAKLARQSLEQSRWLMLWAALRQYPENEHRLLIVQRAFELLDDSNGWAYREAFYRAAIQYLGSRPNVSIANKILAHWPGEDCPEYTGSIDIPTTDSLCENLTWCEFGKEPEILIESSLQGASAETVKEAIALASSSMLHSSGYDAHAVTGIHCLLDLLGNKDCPSNIRHLGWAIGLSSSRTRRQKQDRRRWIRHDWKTEESRELVLEDVVDSVMHDPTGQDAALTTKQFLLSGGDPVPVARALMEIALRTSNPFDAIHNVKMLWGHLVLTQKSQWPQRSWIHLTASACVVAQSVNSSGLRGDIQQQWEQTLSEALGW